MNQMIKHVKLIFLKNMLFALVIFFSLILLIEMLKVQGFFMDNYA